MKPLRPQLELNYFGTLVQAMTEAELKSWIKRLRALDQDAVANVLADELAERHLPPDYPLNVNLP